LIKPLRVLINGRGAPVPGQRHDHRVAPRLDNHGVDRQIPIANQQQAAISNDNFAGHPGRYAHRLFKEGFVVANKKYS